VQLAELRGFYLVYSTGFVRELLDWPTQAFSLNCFMWTANLLQPNKATNRLS